MWRRARGGFERCEAETRSSGVLHAELRPAPVPLADKSYPPKRLDKGQCPPTSEKTKIRKGTRRGSRKLCGESGGWEEREGRETLVCCCCCEGRGVEFEEGNKNTTLLSLARRSAPPLLLSFSLRSWFAPHRWFFFFFFHFLLKSSSLSPNVFPPPCPSLSLRSSPLSQFFLSLSPKKKKREKKNRTEKKTCALYAPPPFCAVFLDPFFVFLKKNTFFFSDDLQPSKLGGNTKRKSLFFGSRCRRCDDDQHQNRNIKFTLAFYIPVNNL
jgi:hypothetical protein